MRIPMAIDGHFWVEAKDEWKRTCKFLVDSGATMTTIDRRNGQTGRVEVPPQKDQVVRTGTGLFACVSGSG